MKSHWKVMEGIQHDVGFSTVLNRYLPVPNNNNVTNADAYQITNTYMKRNWQRQQPLTDD